MGVEHLKGLKLQCLKTDLAAVMDCLCHHFVGVLMMLVHLDILWLTKLLIGESTLRHPESTKPLNSFFVAWFMKQKIIYWALILLN